MCTSDVHRHLGRCMNKVWGHNRNGYLYKVCDECRVSQTGIDPPPYGVMTATVGPGYRADPL